MDHNDSSIAPPLADAFRALKREAVVPPVDPACEAALLDAFDAEHGAGPARRGWKGRRDYWYLAAFAAAAALLVAVGLPAATGRHGLPPGGTRAPHTRPPSARDVQPAPPPDFVIVPGAAELPAMESGTLVRIEVPVSMLPSLGITPPPGQAKAVTADFIVAQDGLARAVRLVLP